MTKPISLSYLSLSRSDDSPAAIALNKAPWKLAVDLHLPASPSICMSATFGKGLGGISVTIWLNDARHDEAPYRFTVESAIDGSSVDYFAHHRGTGSLDECYAAAMAVVSDLQALPLPASQYEADWRAAEALERMRPELIEDLVTRRDLDSRRDFGMFGRAEDKFKRLYGYAPILAATDEAA